MKDLWLPRTVLEADFLVSMPKIKTHHWSGVTLSMKNMFGVVPGARYGWPKNILHWKGIQESILDLCATVPIHFVIADGIVAMEGNGPLNGTASSSRKDRARGRSGGCRCNLRTVDGIRARPNRSHSRGLKIPWQRISCTHRPSWRNQCTSRDPIPSGSGVSIPPCILTNCLRDNPTGTSTARRVPTLSKSFARVTPSSRFACGRHSALSIPGTP